MTEEEKIRELYVTYWECMISKDTEGLRGIMSEDYYLQHMTGTRQAAEEFLKGLTAGTFNYYSAAHDSVDITVHRDEARMTGKSRVTAAVYGGGRSRWKLKNDFTLRKENEEWKLTGCMVSTY